MRPRRMRPGAVRARHTPRWGRKTESATRIAFGPDTRATAIAPRPAGVSRLTDGLLAAPEPRSTLVAASLISSAVVAKFATPGAARTRRLRARRSRFRNASCQPGLHRSPIRHSSSICGTCTAMDSVAARLQTAPPSGPVVPSAPVPSTLRECRIMTRLQVGSDGCRLMKATDVAPSRIRSKQRNGQPARREGGMESTVRDEVAGRGDRLRGGWKR
jgi:hypothetical protein